MTQPSVKFICSGKCKGITANPRGACYQIGEGCLWPVQKNRPLLYTFFRFFVNKPCASMVRLLCSRVIVYAFWAMRSIINTMHCYPSGTPRQLFVKEGLGFRHVHLLVSCSARLGL